MAYAIKEIFATVQGEGAYAGTPAVFVRTVGCNVWSGRDPDRERDAARNAAKCPLWCDTDFVNGERMEPKQLTKAIWLAAEKAGMSFIPHIVVTGGEPLLQVDHEFIRSLRNADANATIAVETNGTVLPKVPVGTNSGIDWICMSPKVAPSKLALTHGHELKVVLPAYDPVAYEEVGANFQYWYVQPLAETTGIGTSLVVKDNMQRAAKFCIRRPRWRLSIQQHKIVGMP